MDYVVIVGRQMEIYHTYDEAQNRLVDCDAWGLPATFAIVDKVIDFKR